VQFKHQKHENFRKKMSRLNLIFGMEFVLCMYDSYFQTWFRHGGHAGWSAGSLDKAFKVNPLRMIQAKFGLNWPHSYVHGYLEKLPIVVLKLTTAGLHFFAHL
jgi:hypothetical protein